MASSFLVYRSVSYTLSDYISIGIVIQLRGGGGGLKGNLGGGVPPRLQTLTLFKTKSV